MVNDSDNNNDKNGKGTEEEPIRIGVIGLKLGMGSDLDDFLPDELKKALCTEMQAKGKKPEEEQPEEEEPKKKTKIKYDFKMVNCNQDLKDFVAKLKESPIQKYGILLFGVSGSGKSYFAKYLAQELKLEYVERLGSDLFDKYVGETEQNIRKAFEEAKKKKAVLVFNEADSLLFDRTEANQSHQVTAVNEILVQMENYPYPFIMTTNLKERVDNAAFRRFIFKIKYDYMTKDNIKAGVKTYFGKSFNFTDEQYKKLQFICPGDFSVVKTKLDILEKGNYTKEKIYEYLLREQEEKNIITGSNEISL